MTALGMREILLPTDFSDVSRAAGRTAADFARHFGARLHVLHVVPPVTDPGSAPEPMREAVADLGPGFTPVVATASGFAARQIVAYAAAHAIDLIVMGTHGRTGFSRALLGSVAEAVLRRAPCRVLTVPAHMQPGVPEAAPPAEPERCVVCSRSSADLICTDCRALIRGEALEHKRGEERAGRRRGV